jgi:formylglycine-generating enzyme required for sulfatase activity
MARIFPSYRRDDSSGYAGRLYDRLSQHFGRDNVFMDVDTIGLGLDFVQVIQDAVGSCDVLLAMIGRQWLTSTDSEGQRRLDNPEDFVRLEITAVLERNIRVIPVLLGGASMPRSTELPDVLRPLARRQALVVGDHFHPDVDRLIAELEKVLGAASPATASSPAPPTAVASSFTNSIGMEFVLIPAGTFRMGSPDSDRGVFDDEKPAHRVTISQPFYLGKYPVTQAQWEAVMGTNPSQFTGERNRPVERVSWEDTQEYIRRLNTREGGARYRLPTEAEWEYACRAGSQTAYCFGDDPSQLSAYGWYVDNSGRVSHLVGQHKPNAWGLYDMHGNVWEWVQDWYGKYTVEPVTDPQGSASGSYRVIRGGGWHIDARDCRSAYRGRRAPGYRVVDLGFRLLRMAR